MYTLIQLEGSKSEMGCQYGEKARQSLIKAYSVLRGHFKGRCISDEDINRVAEEFYLRVPPEWQEFAEEEARCSKISLENIKMLLAMGPLYALTLAKASIDGCAFFYVGPAMSNTNYSIIGRNYDFHVQPYSEIAKDLLVTVLREPGAIPTAFISLPGQVYCLTCVNENGVFASINNGMVSGGTMTNPSNPLVMSSILSAVQSSANTEQLEAKFNSIKPDYSVIANYANATNAGSFEFSSICGAHKAKLEQSLKSMVSTNFYLDDSWCSFADKQEVSDANSWAGITRKQNIETLIANEGSHNSSSVISVLDAKLNAGGATSDYTIYQIAYDTAAKLLFLKTMNDEWSNITLFD